MEVMCMGGYDQRNQEGKIYVLVQNGKEKENWSKEGTGEAIEI